MRRLLIACLLAPCGCVHVALAVPAAEHAEQSRVIAMRCSDPAMAERVYGAECPARLIEDIEAMADQADLIRAIAERDDP